MSAIRVPRALFAPIVSILVLAGIFAPATAHADQVVGPSYPPPGGVTVTPGGDSGRAGGLTWNYDGLGFDFSQGALMFWGPSDASAVGLAFDGTINAAGETLSFSSAASDLPGGVAVWTGSSVMPLALGGSQTFPTRFTLRVSAPHGSPLAFVDPMTEGIAGGNGVVAQVTGAYKVNALFEALNGSTWTPAKTLYDSLGTQPTSSMRTEISAGYWVRYVPPSPPTSLAATPGGGPLEVSLSWSTPAMTGGQPIDGYRIYRGDAAGNETLLTQTGVANSYTDTAPLPLTTYYYTVTAVNSVGESGMSNVACSKAFPWLAQLGC